MKLEKVELDNIFIDISVEKAEIYSLGTLIRDSIVIPKIT